MTFRSRAAVPWLALLALAPFTAPASAQTPQQLIRNGSFETGDFTGFTLANQANPNDTGHNDHFYISAPGSDTPAVDGITFATSPNAQGGQYYAVSTSDNPGAHALLQNFVVPLNATRLVLSFQMFVNDQSGVGPVADASGLDYTTGGAFRDNQHGRVDILRAGASDLSTTAADVVDTLYSPGVDNVGGVTPSPYTPYTYNLSGVLTPGQTYRLRFAEVDNDGALNLGVDNISLIAAVTPEPGTLAYIGSVGLLCLPFLRRLRQTR